jgi:uncharacterized protein with NRDE domain
MSASYYCRGKPGHIIKTDGPKPLEPGFIGISNSPLGNPFQKTLCGLENFKKIVQENLDKSELKEKLIEIMLDKTQHLQDEQMKAQYGTHPIPEPVTSVYVDIPGIYGSRTQTFITIDFDYNIEFVERTRLESGEWSSKQLNYQKT